MLSVSSPNMSKEYALKVVAFVNKVFSTYRENLEERSCKNLALSVVELSDYTYPELYAWLEFLLLGLYKGDKGCTRYRHLYANPLRFICDFPLLMAAVCYAIYTGSSIWRTPI